MIANKMTVLGTDPGLASAGYAVAEVNMASRSISKVRAIGISQTEASKHRKIRKTSDSLARAMEHSAFFHDLIEEYDVDVIAYEMASATPYNQPTFSFGIMMGIISALRLPVIEVLPYEVKLAATGDRNASKQEIIRWAIGITGRDKLDWPTSGRSNKLNLSYRGRSVTNAAEHPADALATIHAALGTEQFRLACAIGRP